MAPTANLPGGTDCGDGARTVDIKTSAWMVDDNPVRLERTNNKKGYNYKGSAICTDIGVKNEGAFRVQVKVYLVF
jgi:hypothetical protein